MLCRRRSTAAGAPCSAPGTVGRGDVGEATTPAAARRRWWAPAAGFSPTWRTGIFPPTDDGIVDSTSTSTWLPRDRRRVARSEADHPDRRRRPPDRPRPSSVRPSTKSTHRDDELGLAEGRRHLVAGRPEPSLLRVGRRSGRSRGASPAPRPGLDGQHPLEVQRRCASRGRRPGPPAPSSTAGRLASAALAAGVPHDAGGPLSAPSTSQRIARG